MRADQAYPIAQRLSPAAGHKDRLAPVVPEDTFVCEILAVRRRAQDLRDVVYGFPFGFTGREKGHVPFGQLVHFTLPVGIDFPAVSAGVGKVVIHKVFL